MKRALVAALLLGCSDHLPASTELNPSSLLCGWHPKDTYDVGSTEATLFPSAGAAVSWLDADPCDVSATPQCWPAGATLQLWARADTSGELDIKRRPCE